MDWFLYDGDLRYEELKTLNILDYWLFWKKYLSISVCPLITSSEVYLETCQTPMKKFFMKIVKG